MKRRILSLLTLAALMLSLLAQFIVVDPPAAEATVEAAKAVVQTIPLI